MCRTDSLTGDDIDKYAIMLGNMVSKEKLCQLLKNPIKFATVFNDMRHNGGVKRGIKRVWQLR